MSITINVYDGAATPGAAAAAPMGAGASVEVADAHAPDAMHAVTDAGPPLPALVQEVEAALLLARAAAPGAAAQPIGIDAGGAPV